MKLKFLAAFRRARLRRRVAIQRAVLADLRQSAHDAIRVQQGIVDKAQADYDDHCARHGVGSIDIAYRVERRGKGVIA